MEAVHHPVEEEVVEQLQTRRRRPDLADSSSDISSNSDENSANIEVDKNGLSEKSVYFDKNEGMWKCHHCIWRHKIGHVHKKSFNHHSRETIIAENVDIPELVNAILNKQNGKNIMDEITSGSSTKQENILNISEIVDKSLRIDLMEHSDEEIELEFERAMDKVHTHTPYCPNCSSQITKVILRRKKKDKPRQDKPVDLFGCLKCFSIFIPSENLFNIFKWNGEQESTGKATESNNEKEKLKKARLDPEISTPLARQSLPSEDVKIDIGDETDGNRDGVKSPQAIAGEIDEEKGEKPYKHRTEHDEERLSKTTSDPRGKIDASVRVAEAVSGRYHSKSLEILKCIVYGGLLELITSLSVVSSAAASYASTLNIIAIGLATVFSGLVVFGNNLVDLKNDADGGTSNQHKDRYQELLGTRGHFVLHASFAILSYLVFGLVPPITYGFMFRESDNKDYKLLAVEVASFACIFLLAIAKAYVRRPPEKLSAYVKTVVYYVTMAVSVSGVSYAAGDLVGLLMEKLGWFQTAQAAGNLLVHGMTSATPAWASY